MTTQTGTQLSATLAKVPQVTLLFWVLKILCTTFGETGGDAVTMSMNLGYLVGTVIFAVLFLIVAFFQIRARHFHAPLYWATIIATTTVGTTLADFADRSLGIGYAGGSALLLGLLGLSLGVWFAVERSISVSTVSSPRVEGFYWITILFSQTLGTALGDWTADSEGLGYLGGIAIFAALLAVLAGCYFWKKISRTFLFWAAFVLTRPLGAVVGDFLDKPHAQGGLALSRYSASAVLLVLLLAGIFCFRHKAAEKAH